MTENVSVQNTISLVMMHTNALNAEAQAPLPANQRSRNVEMSAPMTKTGEFASSAALRTRRLEETSVRLEEIMSERHGR